MYFSQDRGSIVVVEVLQDLCEDGAIGVADVQLASLEVALDDTDTTILGYLCVRFRLHVERHDLVAHLLKRAGSYEGRSADVQHPRAPLAIFLN